MLAPVVGLASGLAVGMGEAVAVADALGIADGEALAIGDSVADGVAVVTGLAIAVGVAEAPCIRVVVIEVISGVVFPAEGTMTITEATAGIDNGELSVFTNSTEKTCKPGVTSGQV